VGYCSTISCVSGNMYHEGYVFTFVMLTINAYICIRSLTEETTLVDRSSPSSLHVSVQDGEESYQQMDEAVVDNIALLDSVPQNKYFCLLYDSQKKKSCTHTDLGLQLRDCNWHGIIKNLVRYGLLITTITGIIPTVAYDDPNQFQVLVLMERAHIFGIMVGIAFILVALSIRLVLRVLTNLCEMENGRIRCEFRLEAINPEDAWTKIENLFDFLLLCINVILLVCYVCVAPARTPASWFCTKYKSQLQCSAADRNLSALLTPWPCVWDASCEVPCSYPNCTYQINGQGIAMEYFVLAYSLLFLSSYMSSFSGGMTKPAERDQVRECLCPNYSCLTPSYEKHE